MVMQGRARTLVETLRVAARVVVPALPSPGVAAAPPATPGRVLLGVHPPASLVPASLAKASLVPASLTKV